MSYRVWRPALTVLLGIACVPIALNFGRLERLWVGQQYSAVVGLVLLDVAAFMAAGLALALLWRAAHRPDARALGVSLAASVIMFGPILANLRGVPVLGDMIEANRWIADVIDVAALGFASIAAAAFARFCTLFPRALTASDIAAYGSMRRSRDSLAWMDDIERWTLGLVNRLAVRLPLRRGVAGGPDTSHQLMSPAKQKETTEILHFIQGRGFEIFAAAPFLLGLVLVLAHAAVYGSPAAPTVRSAAYLAVGLPGILLLILAVSSTQFLRAGYTVANAADRQRMLWLVEGCLAVIWFGFLFMPVSLGFDIAGREPPDMLYAIMFPALLLTILTCLAIAVFGKGALDSSLVIRRTALYGLLGGVLFVIFAVVENVAADLVALRFGISQHIGSWVAAGVLALLARPAHNWLQRRTNHALDRVLPPDLLASEPRADAAILFADIVGFTLISAENEDDGITLGSVFRRNAQRVANSHRGRLVKTFGDGVLFEFATSAAAFDAAVDLRESFLQASGLLGLPQTEIRAGVHFGAVARAPDGDIFGDAVNLAARLQSSASPGELIASDVAVARAHAPGRFRFESLGTRTFRNVTVPVECLRAMTDEGAAAGAAVQPQV